MKIYLDGKYISEQDVKLEYNDRGFLLNDGIFETMSGRAMEVFFVLKIIMID